MAEFVMPPAPPVSPNILVGGDAQFQDNTIITWDGTTVEFGADDSKTPVERGMVAQYDTGTIPLGNDLVIKRAKLEMMPSATYTGSFNANIDVMALNTRLDPVDIVDQDAQFIYRPSSNVFPPNVLWADGRSSGEDITLYKKANTGIGNVTQAWTCLVPGVATSIALKWHIWYLERSATLGAMTIGCNLWSTTGSDPGAYRKNELLDTGTVNSTPDTLVNLGSPTAVYLQTASASGVTVDEGTTYISEIVTTGGISGKLGINLLSTAATGDTQNLSILAYDEEAVARKISSFQERCQWLTGSQIQAAAKAGTGDAGITIPTFTINTLYTFGNPADESPTGSTYLDGGGNETELDEFMADLQTALRARTSRNQWIGVRFTPVISTTGSDERRIIKSVRNSGTTVGSHKGMVLTIEYEDPPPFVVQPPPTVTPGIQVQPLDRAEDEYDLRSEETFRRGLEGELLKISRAVNEATGLTGGVSSSASKRERFLPKVGKVTVG